MNETNAFGGGMWIFALLILMFIGGGFGYNHQPGPPPATQESVTAGFNNQATQTQLQQIALSSANNNYETARLISEQTNQMLQQNNANLINAIQGFNTVNQNLQNQTNLLAQQLMQLDAKMSSCCCEIKTMMLENRLQDAQIALNAANNAKNNADQSQYLLSQMGHWTPNTPAAAAGT